MAEVVSNVTHTPPTHEPLAVASDKGHKVKPHAPRPTKHNQHNNHPTSANSDTDTDSSFSQEQPAPHERKARKSVAFSGDDTIMDENGAISEAPPLEHKTTAEKHSTPPDPDKAVEEVTDMFAGLNKKKKKSSKPKADDADGDAPAVTADGDFDASALKKKKKKSSKPKADGADFAAKLASAGLETNDGEDGGDD